MEVKWGEEKGFGFIQMGEQNNNKGSWIEDSKLVCDDDDAMFLILRSGSLHCHNVGLLRIETQLT